MAKDDKLVSLSGAPIYRHEPREGGFEPAAPSRDTESLEAHIEKHLGAIGSVWHEIISELVHIDVHQIPATPARPFQWLVTTGMSDLPMTPPDNAPECRYAELVVAVPATWPFGNEAFKDERHYWPVRLLKLLARLPHEYKTWLWYGHSVPNGDPAVPYAAGVPFSGCILGSAVRAPREFQTCDVRPDKLVEFLAVIPVHSDEMTLKLTRGAGEFLERLEKAGVSELIDLSRKNVARRWWPFRFR